MLNEFCALFQAQVMQVRRFRCFTSYWYLAAVESLHSSIDKLALSHLQGKRINCLSPRDIILIQSSADAELERRGTNTL
jgi:hypothetical protein